MKHIVYLLSLFVCLVFVSCGGAKKTPQTGAKLNIVTTVGMITDVVSIVAGDQAIVSGLMGAGVDPHLYKASHGDVERLSKADIIFYNGLHLEGKMADVLVKMARERPVIAVTEEIPESLLREPPEFQGQYDPHVWMDPKLWAYTLEPIVKALAAARPEAEKDFRRRADSLRSEMNKLYDWSDGQLKQIPKERRVLVTAHDAFGYFGRTFDIEVMGLQGISTASEYGLADVTNLVNTLVERKIPAVFIETSVPTKPLEAVLEGCKARDHTVKIGGTLYSDAMGQPGTPDGTYIGMIRHNVETVAKALRAES